MGQKGGEAEGKERGLVTGGVMGHCYRCAKGGPAGQGGDRAYIKGQEE